MYLAAIARETWRAAAKAGDGDAVHLALDWAAKEKEEPEWLVELPEGLRRSPEMDDKGENMARCTGLGRDRLW